MSVNTIIKNQDPVTTTVIGVYDGYDEEDGFSFILKSDSELGESIQYFNAVSPDLVKTFKLKNEETIGKTFEITYTLKIVEEEEDGETFEYEYLTIVKLVKK